MFERLEKATAEGELSYYYMRSIVEMSKLVLRNIAKKYEKVRKGVDSVMGGEILEHESKAIHNEGRNEGKMEEKQSIAIRLYKKGTKAEDIADIVDASVNLVKQWISIPAYATGKRA